MPDVQAEKIRQLTRERNALENSLNLMQFIAGCGWGAFACAVIWILTRG